MRKLQGLPAGRVGQYPAALIETLSGLLNLIYPSKCPVCGKSADNFSYSPICLACWSDIKPREGPFCGLCAAPLESFGATVCAGCMKKKPEFSGAVSFGLYDGALKEAISALKFSGVKRLSRPLAGLLAGVQMPRADIIAPVPMETHGLKARGFNQTYLIARVLSKKTGIRLMADNLYKKRRTMPQVGLSRAERLANLKGAFGVRESLGGETVLLVDDIMTTGATARECTRELLRAGAKEVYVAVLARAYYL